MRILSRRRGSALPAEAAAARRPLARAAARVVEGLEPRLLFHFFLANDIDDVSVSPGTPASTIDLTGVVDSEEITGSVVRLATTNGNIDLMLYDAVKPVTVANFLNYVNGGDYNETLVHRTTTNADTGLVVIQGGGYNAPGREDGATAFSHIAQDAQIPDELTTNGLRSNVRGTIAMAKSGPNTATSEWFINLDNNATALDNPANSGGFTVFGEVINNTLANADAIQQLPKFNFGSPFGQLPLRNYTQNDFTAATPVTENHTVTVNTAAVVPEVTYTAASSNEGLVTAAVVNNQLTLTYAGGQVGAADVTVTGTGLDGSVVTDTFSVSVGALGVTIGDGAAKGVTFTDADGTVGTITVRGGTATVALDGTGLTQADGKRGVTVGGAVASIASITLSGTGGASTLTVKAKGGDGLLEIGSISGSGGLKTLAGKQLSVNGDVSLGTAAKIDFADLTGGSITIGGTAPVALGILGGADDSDITSTAPFKSVKLGRFGGSDGVAQTLTAPAIAKLTSGDFAGNLAVSGAVGNVKVTGTATGGAWTVGSLGATTVTGDLGSDLNVGTIKSLKAGSISNADLFARGTIGKVTTGNVTNSNFFSAVPAATLPAAAGDLAEGGNIAGLTVKGTFTASNVAAETLGKLNLGTVTTANGGTAFGVAGNTIASATAGATKVTRATEPSQSVDTEDFKIRVF
jgi:peptidyl-prolyl cis-trans isomerase A (cyclophilin A)